MTVTVRSFAKINLGLRIGAARADGFHDLLTVYQTIALHDVIRVSVLRSGGRVSEIEIRCDDPRVPRDESNTCWRIVEKALEFLETKTRVIVEIEKRLPVQGGLGGASANAVATLLGLERVLRKSLPAAEKLKIAAEVGSDLPLFLVGGTVLGLGRGEQVYPLPDLPATACVVVTPEIGVSTPKAFEEWDRLRGLKPHLPRDVDAALKGRSSTGGHAFNSMGDADAALKRRCSAGARIFEKIREEGPAELRSAWPDQRSDATQAEPKLTVSATSDRMNELGRGLSAWLSELYSGAPSNWSKGRGRAENPLLALVRAGIENDFEQVVFPEYPKLREGKRALLRAGATYASLSGSGSTLYGLFASRDAAAKVAEKLRRQGWSAQATMTLTRQAYGRRMVAG